MSIVAIHQPQYLPWIPYCAKVDACDVFVFLDTVQYQKNGMQNRNQIKTKQGACWLTVPVNGRMSLSINETPIANNAWKKKHIRSIEQNYARAPYIDLFSYGLKPILESPWRTLADLNIAVCKWMFEQLGIETVCVRASELGVKGRKEELVLDVCEKLRAETYLSGKGAAVYQHSDSFLERNIHLVYHDYINLEYKQCHKDVGFVSGLSALDLILNMGHQSREVMVEGNRAYNGR